jgi:hypothetical protein
MKTLKTMIRSADANVVSRKRFLTIVILGIALCCAPGYSQIRRPVQRPQVMPMPAPVQQPAAPAPVPYSYAPPFAPPPQVQLSNACYVSLAPPSGCYLGDAYSRPVFVPQGTPCSCWDGAGNSYNGQVQ